MHKISLLKKEYRLPVEFSLMNLKHTGCIHFENPEKMQQLY